MIHRLGMSAMIISYRNDKGAPDSADGRYHFGAEEWETLMLQCATL